MNHKSEMLTLVLLLIRADTSSYHNSPSHSLLILFLLPFLLVDKLFHAFAQIRPHDTEGTVGGRGSGLGLVIAKNVITLHGGVVIFETEPGKGSVFGFSIPFELSDGHMASGRFLGE